VERVWAGASRVERAGIAREVFFFPSRDDLLYASHYAPVARVPSARVLICPSWGMEGKQLLQWCHQLAAGVSARGGEGLVLHWPGFEDSGGDPHAVDFDTFVDACADAVRHAPGPDDGRWSVAGIRLGGAAAALATKRLDARSLVLVEPALDPAQYFDELERVGRRARLGAPSLAGWAFAHPLPLGLRDADCAARVSHAIEEFAGDAVVIRHKKPERPAPSGIEVRTVPGSWQRGPFDEHRTLLVDALRWIARTSKRIR
jgi:hypothetical protein